MCKSKKTKKEEVIWRRFLDGGLMEAGLYLYSCLWYFFQEVLSILF